MKLIEFLSLKYKDLKYARILRKEGIIQFKEYGLTVYAGRQGGGKTMSMVKQANDYRDKYPSLFIASNFGYEFEDMALKSFKDILAVRQIALEKGCCGILVLWDEIQNDIDSFSKTPLEILRFITQQRKGLGVNASIKILATSQVFTRVSKAIREQCYEVIECKTLSGRWTFNKCYDADEYEQYFDNPEKRKKQLSVKKRSNFIQTDYIRQSYNSYAVIETLTQKAKVEESKNIVVIVSGE